MAKESRMQIISKADGLCEFARKIFNEKRVEMLIKAADLYREATLSLMAEKIEKEAYDWQIWWEKND